MRSNSFAMRLQEVSRAHSTRKGKERTQTKQLVLHPQYVVGFVDGEGSFSVSVYQDATMKNKINVRSEFEIELRKDDKPILERIQKTLGCGIVYDCDYTRYGWYPHAKYKAHRIRDLAEKIIPFFDKNLLQGKKREVYLRFREIVRKQVAKEHLTKKGVREILALRDKMRKLGKKHRLGTARIRENRSSSGVSKHT